MPPLEGREGLLTKNVSVLILVKAQMVKLVGIQNSPPPLLKNYNKDL
jgi:hypothetical protein